MAEEKPAEETKNLFPESRVKEYLKGQDIRISSEALPALDSAVKALLDKAASRAKENKRGTIQAQDL